VSVNIKQLDGSLKKVAGNTILLDGTCSEIQNGIITASDIGTVNVGAAKVVTITLPVAFPDANYAIIFPDSTNSALKVTSQNVTATGFEVIFRNILETDFTANMDCTWYAFRLVELEGYNTIYNKMTNIDSAPTENSTNLVTSGGVYDAIKNASSVFIGTSSEWESETSKTDYQVAILTDQPNINAVNSTDGTTTVVGEPNKRWVGTQAEWGNLTTAEKAKYEIVCFSDDSGASGQDIYSTTETKTNKVWINDKPIYRRVLTEFEITGDSGSWQTISGATISNAEAIVHAAVLRNSSDSNFTHFSRFDIQILSTGEIRILNLIGELSSPINTIILEYTKTTD